MLILPFLSLIRQIYYIVYQNVYIPFSVYMTLSTHSAPVAARQTAQFPSHLAIATRSALNHRHHDNPLPTMSLHYYRPHVSSRPKRLLRHRFAVYDLSDQMIVSHVLDYMHIMTLPYRRYGTARIVLSPLIRRSLLRRH
jgi:hypothetical protein